MLFCMTVCLSELLNLTGSSHKKHYDSPHFLNCKIIFHCSDKPTITPHEGGMSLPILQVRKYPVVQNHVADGYLLT